MGKIARRSFKIVLFSGLFLLAGRYVHTYPLPMTLRQQHYLIVISEKFGINDYESFYINVMMIVDLVVAIVAYKLIMKTWRYYRARAIEKSRN